MINLQQKSLKKCHAELSCWDVLIDCIPIFSLCNIVPCAIEETSIENGNPIIRINISQPLTLENPWCGVAFSLMLSAVGSQKSRFEQSSTLISQIVKKAVHQLLSITIGCCWESSLPLVHLYRIALTTTWSRLESIHNHVSIVPQRRESCFWGGKGQ